VYLVPPYFMGILHPQIQRFGEASFRRVAKLSVKDLDTQFLVVMLKGEVT